MTTQIVILAAGMGSRLGRSLPKPLTELSDGRTIMQQQFDNIHAAFGNDVKVTIVVGYKLEHIIEAFPQASFVYNEQLRPDQHLQEPHRALQASKRRRRALDERRRRLRPRGARARRRPGRRRPQLRLASTPPRCPTKRSSTRPTPRASSTSCRRRCVGGLGEAVGINYVSSRDKAALVRQLRRSATRTTSSAASRLAIAHDEAALRAGRHLRPLRGRDRLRRRPGAREPLRLIIGTRAVSPARFEGRTL